MRGGPILELRGVTKRFGQITAVDAVTLQVPHGQMVGVIGRSGAGKSTLMRLINRLVDPSAGHILFDGRDVAGLGGQALRRWRAECGMIFQQFNLVNRLDVITNVLIGRIGYRPTLSSLCKLFTADERAEAVRALARLDMLAQALQRADTLSGGQQQRVAIARALVQNPRIMLADEPIASLDPRNATKVMDALRTINREDGITVLANLHHVDVAREYCDRIVCMAQGRIVFDGAATELTPAAVQTIYGAEAAAEELAALEDAPPRRRPVRAGTLQLADAN